MNFPSPTDNPNNCPVCGLRPCSSECRLGLQSWDLEELLEPLLDVDELLGAEPPTPEDLREWGKPVLQEEPPHGRAA